MVSVAADCARSRLAEVKSLEMTIAPYTSALSILRIAPARSVTCRSNLCRSVLCNKPATT